MNDVSDKPSSEERKRSRGDSATVNGNDELQKSRTEDDLAASPYFIHENADHDAKKKKSRPEWLNHFNAKDLKTLFKCSVAVWVATLLILINPTLSAFGQATFFGCIVLFILPCNGIVFIHIMGGLTMIAGMAAGWAWGVISMKAALATRPAAETNARLAQLAAEGSRRQSNTEQTTGQSQYTQILIFEGFMLDKRVSITYFCMVGLFVYLVARLRVAAPKLALFQMFAIIVSDIFITIGPLIPSFSGTIPSVLIKPAATAIGIGVACNVLFFPQSTSYLVLETMEGIVAPMEGIFQACKLGFRDSHATLNQEVLSKTKSGVIAAYKGLEASFGFLALDVSGGRWNTQDVQSLHEPLRHLVIMFMSLLQLQISHADSRKKGEKLVSMSKAMRGEGKDDDLPKIGQNHLAQLLSVKNRFEHPESEDLLEKSMGALFKSSGPLLDACSDAVTASTEAIHEVNSRRWFNRPSMSDCDMIRTRHETTLERLRAEQEQFKALNSQHLVDPHNHLFDENGHVRIQGEAGAPIRGLMLGLIYEERILGAASALEKFLTQVVKLERERTKTQIWFPATIMKIFSWGIGKDAAPGVAATPQDSDMTDLKRSPTEQKENKSRKSKKEKKKTSDNDAGPSAQDQLEKIHIYHGAQRSAFGKALLAGSHWLGSTEGMYALRVLIVTIALALPAVLTSTAGFYYREKGLWALIMAQTGLVTYTADFVYGFVLRMIGTVIGGILGMLCWYIGAGNGPGNPYAMAAIMALAIVILMYGRLFAPPALLQGVILMAATIYLVVAYSWVDTHIPSYGNPGVGYSVFWRRALLVVVGFTTAAIVVFIPRPPSASRHYRRVLSDTLTSSKDLYALFVTSYSVNYPDIRETTEKHILQNLETLAEIAGPIQLLKFEFSSSPFDAATLSQVTSLTETINTSLSQLLTYTARLPIDLKTRFSRLSGALDERIVGDLMAVLTLLEQNLKSGEPLPAILPVPLLARCAKLDRAFAMAEAGQGTLSMDTIREEGFREYCVMLSAFVSLLSAADEMVYRVKMVVGETSRVEGLSASV